jgi:Flp pilus assembly protein TadD
LGPLAAEDIAACVDGAEWSVKLAPENKAYRKTLGVAYYRAGRRQEAAALMEMDLGNLGAMIQAEDARQQARGFFQSKQWDKAIGAYAQAIDLEPKTALTWNNLAWLLATCPDTKFRDPARAVELARKAVELAPKEGNYWNTLGMAQYRAGDRKAAIDAYAQAIDLEPKNALTRNNLAWLLATCPDSKLRDPSRAVELAKKAVELTPKDGYYWNTLGVAQYGAGDWKAAIEALKKSMELRNGGNSNDWFFLAMAHWQLRDKPQARSWYDKAVPWMEKNQPKNEELLRFRAEAAALLEVNEKKD